MSDSICPILKQSEVMCCVSGVTCLSVCLFIYLLVCSSICVSHLSLYFSSFCLFLFMFVCPSINTFSRLQFSSLLTSCPIQHDWMGNEIYEVIHPRDVGRVKDQLVVNNVSSTSEASDSKSQTNLYN